MVKIFHQFVFYFNPIQHLQLQAKRIAALQRFAHRDVTVQDDFHFIIRCIASEFLFSFILEKC